jgi:hypothetical protein
VSKTRPATEERTVVEGFHAPSIPQMALLCVF